MRVLVVDDDEAIRALLDKVLGVLGYRDVTCAETGADALRCVEEAAAPFDCFLLDIQMPGMDGVELCRRLREMPSYKDAPIVMLTAMSERAYLDRAFKAGATDYVQKPFDVTELGVRINLAAKIAHSQSALKMQSAELMQEEAQAPENPVAFEEMIEIRGVDRAVNYISFERYVLALPPRERFTSSVFGLRIDGAERLNHSMGGRDFRRVIRIAARAIADAQPDDGPLFTYCGSGVFLCLRPAGMTLDEAALRAAFGETVAHEVEAVLGPGAAGGIEPVIGDSFRLRTLKRGGMLLALRKAQNAVEAKAGPGPGGGGGGRDDAPDRDEYERMLRDFQKDDDDLLRRRKGGGDKGRTRRVAVSPTVH